MGLSSLKGCLWDIVSQLQKESENIQELDDIIENEKNIDGSFRNERKRVCLILAGAYDIMCVAKKDISVRLAQSESPGVAISEAFFAVRPAGARSKG